MATRIRREGTKLYDADFVRWTEEQATALRAGRLDVLDLEHLAEEIESLGKRDRRELDSRLGILVRHLLKWRYQPRRRSGSWQATIRTQRREIEKLLADSPSLRREIEEFVQAGYGTTRRNAATDTGMPPETFPETCPFTGDEILADEWLP